MKRIVWLSVLALFLSFAARAQNPTFVVSGFVNDLSNPVPVPVPNQAVDIYVDSTGNAFFYMNTVYTDQAGYFEDPVTIPAGIGFAFVTVSTYDQCLGIEQSILAAWAQGTQLPSFDFFLCNNSPGDCQAMFYWEPLPNTYQTVQFFDMSFGTYDSRIWDFGDGNSSTEQNPVHTYDNPGLYPVCLSISDSAGFCSNMACETILVGQNWWGCENFFNYYFTDTLTADFMGYLIDSTYQVLSYDWDFGDGTTGSGQTVTHTFTPAGTNFFMVCLTTTAIDFNNDTCVSVSCQEVYVGVPPPPSPCESFFFPSNQSGLTVDFEAYTISPYPTEYTWIFGDNTVGTGQYISHTFPAQGIYIVTLNTLDSAGCSYQYAMEVWVGWYPTSCENYFYYSQLDSLTYEFTGDVVWNDSINAFQTEYFWDFGDGTTGTGQTVQHTFQGPPPGGIGIYLVCLNTYSYSTTGDSCIASSCQEIWVNGGGWDCISWFEYWPSDLTVTFTGNVMSNLPADYFWEFGDGTSGVGQQVTHTYASSGIYMVTLTTTDSAGCTWTSTMEVWVNTFPSFSIFGYVYLANNAIADDATVRLMATDSLWQNVVEVESTMLNDSGFYTFDSIPMYNQRLYFVQAELNTGSAWYGQYLPTYHLSALTWQEATPVLPLNNWTHDIFMIEGTTVNAGTGSITGNVTALASRGPLEGVEIMLMNEDLEPYTYTRSDSNGEFAFNELAFGKYMIYAEIMGINTSPEMIELTQGTPTVEVEVQVAGGEANYFFGMTEKLKLLEGVSNVYPNPSKDLAYMEVTARNNVKVDLVVYSQVGQPVWRSTLTLAAGTQRVTIPTAQLPAGFYYLKVSSEQGDFVTRRIAKVD